MRRVVVPDRITVGRRPAGGAVHTLGGRTMGTTWAVKLGVPGGRPPPADLDGGIRQCLATVVAQMSTWEPDSDLSRYNRAAAGTWHGLPQAFCTVLACALRIAASSGGAYDPTAGALVDAWGFGPAGGCHEPGFAPPGAEAVARARSRIGWSRVVLREDCRCALQPGGVRLDLSAIAKGYAVDRVAAYLEARGFHDHLVEVGGELRGRGVKPDGQPWWVALEPPAATGAGLVQTVVALHGLSVATSGDYRRYFEHGALRYCHTVDPRTGWPVRHGLASVSVLHPECMVADALSTALMVMGPQQGLSHANEHGLHALFVVRRGDGFDEHLSDPLKTLAS